MKKQLSLAALLLLPVLLMPGAVQAQGVAQNMHGLHAVLDQLYLEMISLCERLIDVGRGLAGFAALWYIASRVWRHLANAEPVDFYPLLRPFALGLAILLFPAVLSLLNGVLQPTVAATSAMAEGSDKAIAVLLQRKEAAIQSSDAWQMYVGHDGSGNREKWYQYTHPDNPAGEGILESIGNDMKFAMAKLSFSFRNSIKQWLSEVLQLLFQDASLCINTIRTFYLVVLAILGPLVFGFAVFDGFQHTLTVWIARYVNVYMWLPVANIFGSIIGKIQENMLRLDISQVENNGNTFFSPTDTAYLIFMLIGIVGYFTVPNVANYIIHAGGGNALLSKVTNLLHTSSSAGVATAGSGFSYAAGAMGQGASSLVHGMAGFSGGYAAAEGSSGSGSTGASPADSYQHERLSGKA